MSNALHLWIINLTYAIINIDSGMKQVTCCVPFHLLLLCPKKYVVFLWRESQTFEHVVEELAKFRKQIMS